MKDWQKIAVAGFCGGIVFSATARIFGISHLWFAFTLGFIAGYLGYEFRTTLRAIPTALRLTGEVGVELCRFFGEKIREWAKEPHPFLLLTAPIPSVIAYKVFKNVFLFPGDMNERLSQRIFLAFLMACIASGVIAACIFGFWGFVASVGAKHQNEFFFFEKDSWLNSHDRKEARRVYYSQGLVERNATYSNVFWWISGGIFEVFIFSATAWFYIIPFTGWVFGCTGSGLSFTGRFLTIFLKIIHSNKRVLCGSGGTIGGFIAYALFARSNASAAYHLTTILSGGILGAFGALLEWKILEAWQARETQKTVC